LTWEGQKTVLGFLLDITQQKKLEEQYRHSQKMEAVGVLAGGIAHDFNNLLQIIGGYTEIMMMQATSSDQEKDDIGEVLRAVERAVELTQGLLAFSRKVESVMRPMNLNEQVQHVLKLLSRTLPKSIEIAMNLEEGLTRVSGDPAQIEQVIMNLAVNARDAMPKGGSLTIETKSVQVEYPHPILDYGARRGRYVQVMIRDTGIGMDAYTMARMFDPFFTTKGVGKGTGLGLSMVYGLVKNHGGYIDCRSQPDQGTQFILYFPEDGAGLELVDGGELDLETLKGAARILMVDDEPQIHMVVKRYLESTGYTLRSAISGEEAADIFIRDWRTIDLVLLDLIMPGMGGERLLKKIRENNPEIPVIIVSGAREEDMAEYSRSIGAQAFLKKPFTRKEMLAILHQVLSGGNYLAPATR
jgi:nitrogen-specific signal transduction histidine kinase/ActR/RegA family two-component response regulator